MKILDDARADLNARLTAGETLDCPCCGQLCRVYRRRLHAEMALNLLRLVVEHTKRGAGAFLHVREFVRGGAQAGKASTDASYLVHWGLIERKPEHRGAYRPTSDGIAFVRGELAVPSHVSIYDNRRVGQSRRLITIRDAFGRRFDYDELMRAAAEVSRPVL